MPVTDTLTPLPVKTKTAGDVSVKIDQTTPGTTNGVQVNAALPSGTNIIGKVGIDQTTPGTTNGVQVTGPGASNGSPLFVQTATGAPGGASGNPEFNQLTAGSAIIGKVGIDQTTPGTTNGVQVNAALPAGGNTIGNVGLVAGSALVGKVGIDQTTPGTTNAVQISGPGTSVGNPLYVNTGAGTTGTLKASGALNSGSNIAAAGSATIVSTLISSTKVGTLIHFLGGSAAPMRWDVQTVNASNVPTTVFSGFSNVASNFEWKPYAAGEVVTVAGDAVNVKYQVVATNEDNTNASGAYASFWWTEA